MFCHKVQQRGLAATQGLLEALLDGVELDGGRSAAKANVVILDLMPSRLVFSFFAARGPRNNEFGRACAAIQKEYLRTQMGQRFYFTAYCTGDEQTGLAMKADVAGSFMAAQSSDYCQPENGNLIVRTGGTQRRKLGQRRGPRQPAVWTCQLCRLWRLRATRLCA